VGGAFRALGEEHMATQGYVSRPRRANFRARLRELCGSARTPVSRAAGGRALPGARSARSCGAPEGLTPLPPSARKLDLRKTLFLLPNLITLSSVFCGFDSIRISATAQGDDDFYGASLLLVFALFFDMLDGRVARLTKTQSAFGLQIDSLADAISFGVAPALLVFRWSLWQRPTEGLIAAFLFAAAGVVRLARFNVLSMGEHGAPTRPGKYIVGLPVPGAAGILISLVLANHAMEGRLKLPGYPWAMMGLTVFLSFLMVSTIKFRSFKDLHLNARTFALVAFAVGSSAIVSLQTRPAFVLVWLLSCYVLIGLVESVLTLLRRTRRAEARRSFPPTG
jgi:CDP-diacylglycerol---serine O-phosphatidyltransferase